MVTLLEPKHSCLDLSKDSLVHGGHDFIMYITHCLGFLFTSQLTPEEAGEGSSSNFYIKKD